MNDCVGHNALIGPVDCTGRVFASVPISGLEHEGLLDSEKVQTAVFLGLKNMKVVKKYGKACDSSRLRLAIKKNRISNANIKALFEQYGPELVCSSAEKLREIGVFWSEEKAAEVFPELYPDASSHNQEEEVISAPEPITAPETIIEPEASDEPEVPEQEPNEDPICLPSVVQNRIFRTMESALGHACQAYLSQELPEGEEVGLRAMLNMIQTRSDVLERGVLDLEWALTSIEDGGLGEKRGRMEEAHTVVSMLQAAESFVTTLGVTEGRAAIAALRANVEPKVAAFITKRHSFQARMREKMAYIAGKRAELDELEMTMTRALKEEQNSYDKGVALEIVHHVRNADAALLNEIFQ